MKYQKMNFDAVFKQLNRRPIAFHPVYKDLTGSTVAGILLSQLMYWHFQVERRFYKTDEEIMKETSLTEREIRTAKGILKGMDFIKIELSGIPARTHYEIYAEKLMCAIVNLVQTSSVKTSELESSKRRNSSSQFDGTITEITTETTTEKEYCAFDNAHSPCFDPNIDSKGSIENDAISPAAYETLRTLEDTSEPSIEILDKDPAAYDRLKSRLTEKDKKHFNSIIKIVDEFNRITGRNVSYFTKGSLKLILYWLNEGYDVAQFVGVFDYKYRQFKGTENEKYIAIDTFCRIDKFENNLERARQEWIDNKRKQGDLDGVGDDFFAMKNWVLTNYPNLSQLEWFNKEEYLAIKNREPDFCGQYWRIKATENELRSLIVNALKELNDNPFLRKNHTRIYPYLRDTIKKKLYA